MSDRTCEVCGAHLDDEGRADETREDALRAADSLAEARGGATCTWAPCGHMDCVEFGPKDCGDRS